MIGEIIRKYRKSKDITQEEMANRLGVTAPAVNKWERGVSQPDITLLAPIARLLGITLETLLSFNETLTNEEIGKIVKDIDRRFESDSYDNVFEYAAGIIRQYPNCYQLIWQLALILHSRYMTDKPSDPGSYEQQIEEWYILTVKYGDAAVQRNAADSLFQYYINKENYKEAEKYISFFSEESTEHKRKQAVLYSKTGQISKAYKAYEEIIFSEYQMLNFIFSNLYLLSVDENNMKQAKMWIDKSSGLAELFDMSPYAIESGKLDLAVRLKDTDWTLGIVKTLLASVSQLGDFSQSPMFAHMKFKPIEEQADFYEKIKANLLKSFRDKDTFDYMQENAEWKEIVG